MTSDVVIAEKHTSLYVMANGRTKVLEVDFGFSLPVFEGVAPPSYENLYPGIMEARRLLAQSPAEAVSFRDDMGAEYTLQCRGVVGKEEQETFAVLVDYNIAQMVSGREWGYAGFYAMLDDFDSTCGVLYRFQGAVGEKPFELSLDVPVWTDLEEFDGFVNALFVQENPDGVNQQVPLRSGGNLHLVATYSGFSAGESGVVFLDCLRSVRTQHFPNA